MSDETKVKCSGCERRARALKNTSIRIWRKIQSVKRPIRKR